MKRLSNLPKVKQVELLSGWSQVQCRQSVGLQNTLQAALPVAMYSDTFRFCPQVLLLLCCMIPDIFKVFFTQNKYHPIVSIQSRIAKELVPSPCMSTPITRAQCHWLKFSYRSPSSIDQKQMTYLSFNFSGKVFHTPL